LTLGQRARIKALKDAGWKYSKIAKDIPCSISTIKYTLKQIEKTGGFRNKQERGKKCNLSKSDIMPLRISSL
jgi:transposase